MKKMIVVSAMIAAVVALGACRKECCEPLKLGAGADLPVAEQAIR